jgi:hypothetical protein
MTKDELVKGALTQLGVLSRPDAASPSATASPATAWHSPRFGQRRGWVVLDAGDGWLVVVYERTGGLTWVREDLCHD